MLNIPTSKWVLGTPGCVARMLNLLGKKVRSVLCTLCKLQERARDKAYLEYLILLGLINRNDLPKPIKYFVTSCLPLLRT